MGPSGVVGVGEGLMEAGLMGYVGGMNINKKKRGGPGNREEGEVTGLAVALALETSSYSAVT